MERLNRTIQLDFHTPDGVYNFGEGFDAVVFAQTLKDAHVTYINACAQCNFGYDYYDTKIGERYPAMKGDMFGDLVQACHEAGIGVSAYINIGINNIQAKKHPEWCRINKEGCMIRGDLTANNGFIGMCGNTGYRKYLLQIIKEIISYDVDGIYCDCMSAPRCYCSSCVEEMRKKGIRLENDDAVSRFAFDSLYSLAYDIRAVVPESKRLILSGVNLDVAAGLASHLEIECLPGGFGGWGYDYMGPMAAYARNLKNDVLYMSGRFHASWGDFGGIKEKASLENDLFDALCNNVGFSVGDHMNPAGNLDRSLYTMIGQVFEKAKKYEKWTLDASYCAQIGIVRNKVTYQTGNLTDELRGAVRMLSELKYTFDIVNEDMDLEKYEVLILPDRLKLNEKLREKISRHLQKGKYVLSSGTSCYEEEAGKFGLKEYNFLEVYGYDADTAGCYRLTEEGFGDLTLLYSQYLPGIQMKVKDGQGILAMHVDHYFKDRWDRPYFDYRWTTDHIYTYLPPEKDSGFVAVAMQKHICHIAFEIFDCYYKYAAVFQKKLVGNILEKMIKEPFIKTEGIPSTARVSLTGTEDYKLLHVKVTYPEARGKWFEIVEEHNKLPAGAVVEVKGEYHRVVRLPQEQSLKCSYAGGYTRIELPEIEGYDMFLLQ